jgi:hypothetical protein
MKILYLGNWSFQDALSISTIKPHLQVLSEMNEIEVIHYVSLERGEFTDNKFWEIEKVIFDPYLFSYSNTSLGQLRHLMLLPLFLSSLIRKNNIDYLICRSSPAGNYGYLTYLLTGIDYAVESFEPHSRYMLDNGVWRKNNLRYFIQSFLEKKQKRTASALIPVSQNYFDYLIKENKFDRKLYFAPCAVDQSQFGFRTEDRVELRQRLKINSKSLVGIYVGKFGDIYYGLEAVSLFAKLKKNIKNFHLIILSNDQNGSISNALIEAGFDGKQFTVDFVNPSEVPKYLSAADFAISLVRSTESSIYCSPIKHGEYWANGLPIMMEANIGDDSEIIEKSGNGIVTNLLELNNSDIINKLLIIIERTSKNRISGSIIQLVKKHRNFANIKSAYQEIITAFSVNQMHR